MMMKRSLFVVALLLMMIGSTFAQNGVLEGTDIIPITIPDFAELPEFTATWTGNDYQFSPPTGYTAIESDCDPCNLHAFRSELYGITVYEPEELLTRFGIRDNERLTNTALLLGEREAVVALRTIDAVTLVGTNYTHTLVAYARKDGFPSVVIATRVNGQIVVTLQSARTDAPFDVSIGLAIAESLLPVGSEPTTSPSPSTTSNELPELPIVYDGVNIQFNLQSNVEVDDTSPNEVYIFSYFETQSLLYVIAPDAMEVGLGVNHNDDDLDTTLAKLLETINASDGVNHTMDEVIYKSIDGVDVAALRYDLPVDGREAYFAVMRLQDTWVAVDGQFNIGEIDEALVDATLLSMRLANSASSNGDAGTNAGASLANEFVFESGLTVAYPDDWELISDSDLLIVLQDDNFSFVQVFDLGTLFTTDFGHEFILQTYGDVAADSFGDDDFTIDSWQFLTINGVDAYLYQFTGDSSGTPTDVIAYVLDFDDGNYVYIQSYVVGTTPDTFASDVETIVNAIQFR